MARHADWRAALDFEGSRYVGLISRIFEELPFEGMTPDYIHTYGRAGLWVPDKLFLVYLPDGGEFALARTDGIPSHYRVIDLCSGKVVGQGEGYGPVSTALGVPRVVIWR